MIRFILTVLVALSATPSMSPAEAASCKASLTKEGIHSVNRTLAQNAARARWEFAARRIHGRAFDDWEKAQAAQVTCELSGFTNARGSPFYLCTAKARPCPG